MRGTVSKYDRWGKCIGCERFIGPAQEQKIIEKWKRLYGKGWKLVVVKVEYDEPIKKKKVVDDSPSFQPKDSNFKKGYKPQTYRMPKPTRLNFDK